MIKRPTVLILGAGASAHVGYPVGIKLLNEVCRLGGDTTPKIDGSLTPDGAAVSDFLLRLSRSGFYSVDAFLEENPEFTNLGKYLTAKCLKKYEDESRLFAPHSPGWYQYLFSALHTPEIDALSCNRLTIISFNYDRSLECYLHQTIQHRYRTSSQAALDALTQLKIIHVHGTLGAYPQTPYSPAASPEQLHRIAKSIQIIHEVPDAESGFCSPEFEQSNEALKQSEKVYFLGFGFHDANMRRFGFFTPEALPKHEVLATTFGMYQEELDRMAKRLHPYGIKRSMLPNDSSNCEVFFQRKASLE